MGREHDFFVGDFVLVGIVFLFLVIFREQLLAALVGGAETADSLLLRLMMVILQCGHGKSTSSFLPDSGQKNSRIPFQISCLGVPLMGGGLFNFLIVCQFDKLKLNL